MQRVQDLRGSGSQSYSIIPGSEACVMSGSCDGEEDVLDRTQSR